MYKVLLLIATLTIISCETRKASMLDELANVNNLPHDAIEIDDSTKKARVLKHIIGEITTISVLEQGTIGIGNVKSKQENYVDQLVRFADTGLLVNLTNNIKPIARVVAYQALVLKKYPGSKTILKNHLFDKESYLRFSGCTKEEVPVNISFYNMIDQVLSKKEREYYHQQLSNQYGRFCLELNELQ